MIQAKIIKLDNKEYIQATFPPSPTILQDLKRVRGAKENFLTGSWLIPIENKKSFEDIMGNYLIVWEGQKIIAGGISEESISKYPVVPGYSVTYDNNGNIIDYTGFKTCPWGEFQVRGFNALVTLPFVILADDAGLGKSFQVATAMEARKKKGEVKRGVILCKSSLLYNWRDEIHTHTNCKAVVIAGTPQQRAKLYASLEESDDWTFLIISYKTYNKDITNINIIDNTKPLDFLIIDEGHVIKNPTSEIGECVHRIPYKYNYILTATPSPNTPLEFYNYLRLGNKINMNWWQFKKTFAEWGGFNDKEIVGYKNMNKLKELINRNMLRRLKKDKLKELPDVVFRTVKVDMSPTQTKIYNGIKKEILEDLGETTLDKIPAALAKMLRLQQVTDSPALLGGPDKSAKLDALDELLEDLINEAGHKVIVFSRFKTVVNLLQEKYSKYNPAVIHGEVSAIGKSRVTAERSAKSKNHWATLSKTEQEKLIEKETSSERQQEVYRFQNDDSCKLFIGCAPACREGLTLTAAHHVVFVDVEWAWDYIVQAYSRAHRIGQKNSVTVHFLVCNDTIDEHTLNTVRKKKAISESVLDSGGSSYSAKEMILEMLGGRDVIG